MWYHTSPTWRIFVDILGMLFRMLIQKRRRIFVNMDLSLVNIKGAVLLLKRLSMDYVTAVKGAMPILQIPYSCLVFFRLALIIMFGLGWTNMGNITVVSVHMSMTLLFVIIIHSKWWSKLNPLIWWNIHPREHLHIILEIIINEIRRVVGALVAKRILLSLSVVLRSYWAIHYQIGIFQWWVVII